MTVERSIFSSVARKIRERCEPKDHLQQAINQPHLHSILRAFGVRMSYRLTFVLFFLTLSLKQRPFTFVQWFFFDVRTPRQPKNVFPFPLLFILEISLFSEYFLYHCHFPTSRSPKKTRLNEKIHHLEGKNVQRTLHTKRKWQWYKKYSEKSDISKINKRGKGRNTFWLSGRPHIEE